MICCLKNKAPVTQLNSPQLGIWSFQFSWPAFMCIFAQKKTHKHNHKGTGDKKKINHQTKISWSWLLDSNQWPSFCEENRPQSHDTPHTPASLININRVAAVSGLTPSVVWVRFRDSRFQGGSVGRWATPDTHCKSTHSVKHTCTHTHTPLLIKHGADMLFLPSLTMWVFCGCSVVVCVCVCGSRWWRSGYLCVCRRLSW